MGVVKPRGTLTMATNREVNGEDYPLNVTTVIGISVVVGSIGIVLLIVMIIRGRKEGENGKKTSNNKPRKKSNFSAPLSSKQKKSKEFKYPIKKGGLKPHPLSAADFKGHTDCITGISFELGGKYLVSCSDDRTFRVWVMKTVQDKEHKYTRVNLDDNDHASNVAFSPDGTAVLLTASLSNSIVVYKLVKSKTSLTLNNVLQFELTKETADEDVVSLEIASNGKYILTCTQASFSLWTLKGDKLATVETRQSPNNLATISKCSKFVACCGFTTDVKIWEVSYSKGNEFQSVKRAMELKGHSAGVLSVCFSQDSKRAFSLSKDKTFKMWNVDVSYTLNEDPRVLLTINLNFDGIPSQMAVSPDSSVVAVSYGTSIAIYSTTNGTLLEALDDIHNAPINCLLFEPSDGRYLVSTGGPDRFIRLWHNIPGMREQMKELKKTLAQTNNQSLKDRLNVQLQELEVKLKTT